MNIETAQNPAALPRVLKPKNGSGMNKARNDNVPVIRPINPQITAIIGMVHPLKARA